LCKKRFDYWGKFPKIFLEDVSFALVRGAFTKKIVFSAKPTQILARIYQKPTRISRVVAIPLLKLAKSE